MRISDIEVYGFSKAFKGVRNAMNSWDRSDSETIREDFTYNNEHVNSNIERFELGENDLKLGQNLIKAGAEHCKFMRQIHVWFEIDMPRYIWSELDTYHYNTKNSCSTMHRLLHKTVDITKDLFFYNTEDEDLMEAIIVRLNEIRNVYLNEPVEREKNKLIRRAKQLLPEGFLQLRTMDTNYAELRNIVLQRKGHKLNIEWRQVFCKTMTTLPYARELIFYGIEDEYDKIKGE